MCLIDFTGSRHHLTTLPRPEHHPPFLIDAELKRHVPLESLPDHFTTWHWTCPHTCNMVITLWANGQNPVLYLFRAHGSPGPEAGWRIMLCPSAVNTVSEHINGLFQFLILKSRHHDPAKTIVPSSEGLSPPRASKPNHAEENGECISRVLSRVIMPDIRRAYFLSILNVKACPATALSVSTLITSRKMPNMSSRLLTQASQASPILLLQVSASTE